MRKPLWRIRCQTIKTIKKSTLLSEAADAPEVMFIPNLLQIYMEAMAGQQP